MNVVYQSPTNRDVDKNGECTTPRISIAMATYNGGQFIQEQLDSLALQTVLPYELVVTDDGSTDWTVQIVQTFAKNSPFPVRIYINDQRLGYADNFLKAASLCEGEFISFCDQDDVWKACKLATITPFLGSDVSMVVHSFEYVDAQLRPVRVARNTKCFPRKTNNIDYLSSQNIFFNRDGSFNCYGIGFTQPFKRGVAQEAIHRWHKMIRLDGCQNAGSLLGHDDFMVCIAGGMGIIACLPDVLVKYRQHNANTSSEHGKKTRIISISRMLVTGYGFYIDRSNSHLKKACVLSYLSNIDGRELVSQCLHSLSMLHEKRAESLLIRSQLYDPSIGYLARTALMFHHLGSSKYRNGVNYKNVIKDIAFSLLNFSK
jgi:glycosyltransferase involved in cell wall biosynthesis